MLPVLQIGPLALQTPGLLILLGIWLGLSASERTSSRLSIDSNHLYNLVLISLIAGILGARLAYVIQYSSIFIASPLNIFSFTLTMLNGEAGLLIGLIAGFIYVQRRSMPVWETLDALASGFSIFMIFFHLANFASGDAFGAPVQMPLSINLWGQPRYPVQLYETAAALLIAVALNTRKQRSARGGTLFWAFMALSALARLFFEFFRGDSTTLLGGIHIAQVIAWIILAFSLWQLGKRQGPAQKPLPVESAKDDKYAA